MTREQIQRRAAIRRHLKAEKISLREFARRLGCSAGHLCDIMSGKKGMGPDIGALISRSIGEKH